VNRLAEPGLLLRLTGPLQSWGEHSHFNDRDTARFPTRSGVLGLLAAALGRPRTAPLDDLGRLSLTVRADRPGVLLRDLHTVGGGLPPKATVTTAEGKKRSGDTTTLLTYRYYLADAAFTVALTDPDPAQPDTALLNACARALQAPRWPLFLGRRSCPPEGPLLLGLAADALHHLVRIPLADEPPRTDQPSIEFFSDRPLSRLPVPDDATAPESPDGDHPSGHANDEPLSYHPQRRTYRKRPVYRRALRLPHTQYAGHGTGQLRALRAYLAAADRITHPEGIHR
jgi:CRISPR system Cascade subunit CasD